MIKSMTGYGIATTEYENKKINVEIRGGPNLLNLGSSSLTVYDSLKLKRKKSFIAIRYMYI